MGKALRDPVSGPACDRLLDAVGIIAVLCAIGFALFTHPLLALIVVLVPFCGGALCCISKHLHRK